MTKRPFTGRGSQFLQCSLRLATDAVTIFPIIKASPQTHLPESPLMVLFGFRCQGRP